MIKDFNPKALPAFAEGATMYQIFLRQFTPEGTISAAEKLIPHIASLGIKIVYLCPFNEADDDMDQASWSPRQVASGMNNPKNPYRMNDYYKIDPEYGTDDDLKNFIKTAHEYNLKVMLDLVYYHCGPKANLLSMDSEMVKRDEDGKPMLGWWRFPILNFDSNKLREYLLDNMLYFVREFDIDGYRCDVGSEVPLDFWEESRRRIAKIKKHFIMLTECNGTQADEREAFELSYGFRQPDLINLTKGEITAKEFRTKIDEFFADGRENLRIMWYSDNHDVASDSYEERLERMLPTDRIELLLSLIFCLDGMPLLYNGQEIADSNRHSLWANHEYGKHLGINWSNVVTLAGQRRLDYIKQLTSLRAKSPVLYSGTFKWLDLDSSENVLGIERELNGEKLVGIFNFSDNPFLLNEERLGDVKFLLKSKKNSVNSYNIAPKGMLLIEKF